MYSHAAANRGLGGGSGSLADQSQGFVDPALRSLPIHSAAAAAAAGAPGSPMQQQTRSGRISRPPLQQPPQPAFDLGLFLQRASAGSTSASSSLPFGSLTNREMAHIVASAARLAQAQQAVSLQSEVLGSSSTPLAGSSGDALASRAMQNDQTALREMMLRRSHNLQANGFADLSASARQSSQSIRQPAQDNTTPDPGSSRNDKRKSVDHRHPYATPSPESGSDHDTDGSDSDTTARGSNNASKRQRTTHHDERRAGEEQDGSNRTSSGRPRRRPNYKTKEESAQARRERNRQTATKARERRQAEMLEMADKIKALEKELAELKERHGRLADDHHQLQRAHARCSPTDRASDARDAGSTAIQRRHDGSAPTPPSAAFAPSEQLMPPASTPDDPANDPWLLFQAFIAQHGGLPSGNEEDDEDDAEFMPSSPRHDREDDEGSDNDQTPRDPGTASSTMDVATTAGTGDYALRTVDPSASHVDGTGDDFYDPDDYFNDPDMEDEDLFQPIEDVEIPDGELEAIQAMYENNLPPAHYLPQYDPEMVLGAILSARGGLAATRERR